MRRGHDTRCGATLPLARRVVRPCTASLALALCLALGGCEETRSREPLQRVPGGDAERGAALIQSYGCGSCHVVPGVRTADGMVGPPLTAFGRRVYIAGQVANTPEHLITWIEVPQSIEPGTAMPNLGVSEQEARDIAAYLYTLR